MIYYFNILVSRETVLQCHIVIKQYRDCVTVTEKNVLITQYLQICFTEYQYHVDDV